MTCLNRPSRSLTAWNSSHWKVPAGGNPGSKRHTFCRELHLPLPLLQLLASMCPELSAIITRSEKKPSWAGHHAKSLALRVSKKQTNKTKQNGNINVRRLDNKPKLSQQPHLASLFHMQWLYSSPHKTQKSAITQRLIQSKCHLFLDQLQKNTLWELLIFCMSSARQRECHCILKTDFKSVVSENKG